MRGSVDQAVRNPRQSSRNGADEGSSGVASSQKHDTPQGAYMQVCHASNRIATAQETNYDAAHSASTEYMVWATAVGPLTPPAQRHAREWLSYRLAGLERLHIMLTRYQLPSFRARVFNLVVQMGASPTVWPAQTYSLLGGSYFLASGAQHITRHMTSKKFLSLNPTGSSTPYSQTQNTCYQIPGTWYSISSMLTGLLLVAHLRNSPAQKR